MTTNIRLISVEKTKRKKGWYKCSFDNSTTFDVPDILMIKYALRSGLEINNKDFLSIKNESLTAFGKDHALNLLSFRERSEFELKNRLNQKGLDKDSSKKVIEDLKKLNLLDDEKFAKRFLHDLIMRKPCGELLIKNEFYKKGINKNIISKVLDEFFLENNPIDIGKRCADKWIKSHPRVPDSDKKIKVSKHLQSRGFTWSIIEQVLGEYSAF